MTPEKTKESSVSANKNGLNVNFQCLMNQEEANLNLNLLPTPVYNSRISSPKHEFTNPNEGGSEINTSHRNY